MNDDMERRYNPPPEFNEDSKEPLFDLTSSDSTEFWLIQWPKNQNPDIDGQQLTLKLHLDGNIGSFKDSSGKKYDAVSVASKQPNASVFVSSASGTKIVGNISRLVSFEHYSEPEELQQRASSNLKKTYQRFSSTSMTNSSHKIGTPQSSRHRNSQSTSRYLTSTHSSRQKSSVSEVGEQQEEPSRSVERSSEISDRERSGVTLGSSLDRSHQGKSKKRRKSGEE